MKPRGKGEEEKERKQGKRVEHSIAWKVYCSNNRFASTNWINYVDCVLEVENMKILGSTIPYSDAKWKMIPTRRTETKQKKEFQDVFDVTLPIPR